MFFYYDADGKRVRKDDPNGTTAYAGAHFEKNAYTGVQRATYSFNGQVVAVRNGATTTWLHTDHLGSASLATDVTGVPVANSDTRYTPWGEVRTGGVGAITDRGFTSQRREDNLRLNDYVARFYNPFIGKFVSPDSIVPGPTNPQSFNRYSMTLNNPVRYTDPTGHWVDEPDEKRNATKDEISIRSYRTKAGKFDPLAYAAARINQNMAKARRANSEIDARFSNNPHLNLPGLKIAAKLQAFASLVCGGCEFDIKYDIARLADQEKLGFASSPESGSYFFFRDGKAYDSDDAGNFGAGYVGAAFGFSGETVLTGGAIYQAAGDTLGSGRRNVSQVIYDALAADAGEILRNPIAVLDEPEDRVPVRQGGVTQRMVSGSNGSLTGNQLAAALVTQYNR